MKKFTEWMKIRELATTAPSAGGMTPGMTGLATGIKSAMGNKTDPAINKFVADVVGDKTGNPRNMLQKGTKMAELLRRKATQSAQQGDYTGAFKNATDAAKMQQIAASIK